MSIGRLVGSQIQSTSLARIPVALVTRGYKGKQRFAVTGEDLRNIVANFRKRKTDIPLDFEHSTLNAGSGVPTATAGWLKRLDDGPDENGVLWGYVEYTAQGRKAVEAKDYKYVSPVIEWGTRDKTTGEQQGATVTSVALTKQPLFENVPSLLLVASESEWRRIAVSVNNTAAGDAYAVAVNAELERRRLARGGVRTQASQGHVRLAAGEQLAQRLDQAQQVCFTRGLPDINSWIEREVYAEQQRSGCSREVALQTIAKEYPELFLTKARLELDQQVTYGEKSVFFTFVDGQLVDPRVQESDGTMRPLDSPLDTRAISPNSSADQEIALRVAAKMAQLAASGRGVSYGEAMKLVASECPRLAREYWRESGRRAW